MYLQRYVLWIPCAHKADSAVHELVLSNPEDAKFFVDGKLKENPEDAEKEEWNRVKDELEEIKATKFANSKQGRRKAEKEEKEKRAAETTKKEADAAKEADAKEAEDAKKEEDAKKAEDAKKKKDETEKRTQASKESAEETAKVLIENTKRNQEKVESMLEKVRKELVYKDPYKLSDKNLPEFESLRKQSENSQYTGESNMVLTHEVMSKTGVLKGEVNILRFDS